jgi:cytochrome c-type biogenesis protein
VELTLAAAFVAGLVSFLSPCVLPVVPAYLGQLGVVAVAGLGSQVVATGSGEAALAPSRPSWGAHGGWRTLPNALAFVLGFGTVFTLFGTTVYVAAGPLRDNLPLFRTIGGILVVILGLNLMGVLRPSLLGWSWRPLDRFVGRRPGAERKGILGGFTLGAIFSVGWTPCIGPTLGAILGLAAVGASPQVVALFVAYALGLGVPFIVLALMVDRAPAITRPLLRHGRTIEVIGGALVVLIGLAIVFDWLAILYRTFSFLVPQV